MGEVAACGRWDVKKLRFSPPLTQALKRGINARILWRAYRSSRAKILSIHRIHKYFLFVLASKGST
ncbi:MAG: hypothetical protein ACR2P1_04300, partial [Pseudomonadales bacterium]